MFKQSTTTEIWPVPESDNVQSLPSESSDRNLVSLDSGYQIGRIPAIWPEQSDSGKLAGSARSGQNHWIGRMELPRTSGFQPFWRDSGQNDRL